MFQHDLSDTQEASKPEQYQKKPLHRHISRNRSRRTIHRTTVANQKDDDHIPMNKQNKQRFDEDDQVQTNKLDKNRVEIEEEEEEDFDMLINKPFTQTGKEDERKQPQIDELEGEDENQVINKLIRNDQTKHLQLC